MLAPGFLYHLVIDGLLALQQLQTHIGGTEVATDADEVGLLGTVTIDDILLAGLTDAGDRDGQTGVAAGGVATHDVDAPLVAGGTQAFVELLDVLYGEALAQGQRDGHLARRAIHGEDVADVDHGRLVTQVLQGDVGEVEVDALHEHVGGDEHLCVRIVKYGAVIAYAVLR